MNGIKKIKLQEAKDVSGLICNEIQQSPDTPNIFVYDGEEWHKYGSNTLSKESQKKYSSSTLKQKVGRTRNNQVNIDSCKPHKKIGDLQEILCRQMMVEKYVWHNQEDFFNELDLIKR